MDPVLWPKAPHEAADTAVASAAAAERTMQTRLHEAYERGLRDGEARFREHAEREIDKLKTRLAETITSLVGQRSQLYRESEKQLAELSIAVARHVLHRELEVNPEALEGFLRAVLDRLESRPCYRVRVHPEQESFVRESLARVKASVTEVIADPNVRPWDMLFDTSHGTLDASLEAQLEEIRGEFSECSI